MADETQADEPTKIEQLVEEFEANKRRLKARGIEIGNMLTEGKLDQAMLGHLVLELFLELHDTALSLQADLTQALLEHEALLGDLALGGAPVDDEEDDSLLLRADAAQLRRTTLDYRDLVTQLLPNYQGADRVALEEKLKQAAASLALIDEIEEEEGDEGDDDDGDDADDDEADGADTDQKN